MAKARQAERKSRIRVRSTDRSDPWIIGSTLLLVFAGLVFVLDTTYFISEQQYGSNYWMLSKHIASVLLGAAAMLVLSRVRSDKVEALATPLLIGSLAFLVAPLVSGIGHCSNGACRWVNLGPVNLQPGEFAKLAFVVYAAATLTRASDKIGDWRYGSGPILGVAALFGTLLLLEPDFGTAAVIFVAAGAMLFLGGIPLWQVGSLGTLGAVGAALLVYLEPYRMQRFVGFMDPWADARGAGYQLAQSFRAFGSGKFVGVGMGGSRQKAGWLPEAHTDFIFSVIGEETGLLGATIILVCFAVLAYRGFRVAHRHPDSFGQMLAGGVTFVIIVQALFNVCVALGLLPTKGMVLPFLSYGGSAMMVTLAMVGLLMSLSRELRER